MTSNIGSHQILERSGGDWQETERIVLAELRRHFRPEFLNRVDDIIVFHPLGKEELHQIVGLQLERVRSMLAERGITVRFTDEALDFIASEGYDPAFGARPLKRAIQRLVQNPLAVRLLEGEFSEGDTLVVDVDNGQLQFREEVAAGATTA